MLRCGDPVCCMWGLCKLGAFETRVHIKSLHGYYLCPLSQTGVPADEFAAWVQEGIALSRRDGLQKVTAATKHGDELVVALGYERDRQQTGTVNGDDCVVQERVFVVQSFAHATRQAYGLEQRLTHAEQKIAALTPPRGPGKRQITDEVTLQAAIDTILTTHRVDGLLTVTSAREVERKTQYICRGKGGVNHT